MLKFAQFSHLINRTFLQQWKQIKVKGAEGWCWRGGGLIMDCENSRAKTINCFVNIFTICLLIYRQVLSGSGRKEQGTGCAGWLSKLKSKIKCGWVGKLKMQTLRPFPPQQPKRSVTKVFQLKARGGGQWGQVELCGSTWRWRRFLKMGQQLERRGPEGLLFFGVSLNLMLFFFCNVDRRTQGPSSPLPPLPVQAHPLATYTHTHTHRALYFYLFVYFMPPISHAHSQKGTVADCWLNAMGGARLLPDEFLRVKRTKIVQETTTTARRKKNPSRAKFTWLPRSFEIFKAQQPKERRKQKLAANYSTLSHFNKHKNRFRVLFSSSCCAGRGAHPVPVWVCVCVFSLNIWFGCACLTCCA